jgi:signal transduction histidine kinase
MAMSHRWGADDDGAARAGWLLARPVWLVVALDAVAVALALAAVAQLADPDPLLHVVWIVLALEAFAFGLRTVLVRIAVASLFVVGYALAANDNTGPLGLALADLDLEEWPLMGVIAVLVSVMAERVRLTGHRYAALYRAASDRLLTAQEDERKRLALDLHDDVGQTITALLLTLDAADASLGRAELADPAARDAVRRAREMAGLALDDVRDVAFRLRPPRLRETGLVAALRELVQTAGTPAGFYADVELDQPSLLDPASEVEAYRIVQEALANATRHGHAREVTVSVQRIRRHLRIEVSDDGVGFDPRAVGDRGIGLASMQDRASAMGGTLAVRSRPGSGTLVRLDVPLATAAPAAQAGPADEQPEWAALGMAR